MTDRDTVTQPEDVPRWRQVRDKYEGRIWLYVMLTPVMAGSMLVCSLSLRTANGLVKEWGIFSTMSMVASGPVIGLFMIWTEQALSVMERIGLSYCLAVATPVLNAFALAMLLALCSL